MRKSLYSASRSRGFSLVEALIVIAIILIITATAVVSIQPTLKQAHSDAGAAIVADYMRRARDLAVGERRNYQLQFTQPGGQVPGYMQLLRGTYSSLTQSTTYTPYPNGNPTDGIVPLPNDMQFLLPTTKPVLPPDGFGAQANNIDFYDVTNPGNNVTLLTFRPDGTVVANTGGTINGAVYMARPNDDNSPRAVTLFGATGRIKKWRVVKTAGAPVWKLL